MSKQQTRGVDAIDHLRISAGEGNVVARSVVLPALEQVEQIREELRQALRAAENWERDYQAAVVRERQCESRLAEMTTRAEKAEAELAELKSPGKIASQLKAVRDVLGISDKLSRPLHLYVADVIASRERLAAAFNAACLMRDRLAAIEASEEYKAIWTTAYAHGRTYAGENYVAERDAFDVARAAVDAAGDLGGAP